MWKFRQWLARFMYGRYGSDELGRFLIIVNFAVIITSWIIARVSGLYALYLLLYLLSLALAAIIVRRAFSRKIEKRYRENQKFLAVKQKAVGWLATRKARRADKEHCYRRCPSCHAQLRLPNKKGKHSVTCPKCKVTFDVII